MSHSRRDGERAIARKGVRKAPFDAHAEEGACIAGRGVAWACVFSTSFGESLSHQASEVVSNRNQHGNKDKRKKNYDEGPQAEPRIAH